MSVIHIGTLEINMTQHSVYKDGKEILLTNTEFKMLYYLTSNKGLAIGWENRQRMCMVVRCLFLCQYRYASKSFAAIMGIIVKYGG